MPFATHRPTAVLEAQTELGFAAWTYCTHDPLAEVLKPNCFAGAIRMLRPGDPIVHGTNPQPSSSPWRERAGEVRRALLMVAEVRNGRVLTRLVQDGGRPEDASDEPADAGRPTAGDGAAEADGARVDGAAANVTPLAQRGRRARR